MIQPGRLRMVSAHVVLPEDCVLELRQLDAIRARAQAALEADYRPVIADLLFTADPAWGAVAGQEKKGNC